MWTTRLYLCRVTRVGSRTEFSAQTLSVLAALCEQPSQWQHGYALARQTGLKSGTLYPVLIRLADRGLVEACWEDEQPAGRPRRHLYRLTPEGLAADAAALTRVTVALLQYSAGLLPADRRVWARALVAEADELPAGWRRLAWLAGGVRLTVREAMPRRRLGYPLAFAAAAVGTAWSAW